MGSENMPYSSSVLIIVYNNICFGHVKGVSFTCPKRIDVSFTCPKRMDVFACPKRIDVSFTRPKRMVVSFTCPKRIDVSFTCPKRKDVSFTRPFTCQKVMFDGKKLNIIFLVVIYFCVCQPIIRVFFTSKYNFSSQGLRINESWLYLSNFPFHLFFSMMQANYFKH